MTQERNGTVLLERPLSPRSLVGSLLLGMRPPRMPASRLVEWCALFGVADGTARVALSRMVERGELTATDGVYELAGRLRRRQPAQDWSLRPEPAAWTGSWVLGVVGPGARAAAERSALREAGRQLRMAELREGVWCRPDNLPRTASPPSAWETADAQCTWWVAQPDADSVSLAVELFDPRAWAERAGDLRRLLVSATAAVAGGEGTDDRRCVRRRCRRARARARRSAPSRRIVRTRLARRRAARRLPRVSGRVLRRGARLVSRSVT